MQWLHSGGDMKGEPIIVTLLFHFAVLLFVGLVLSFPIMWLWNWLMPVIFGLKAIGVLQALGLYLLSSMLLKSVNTNN